MTAFSQREWRCFRLTRFSSHSSLNCWNFWDIRSWALPTALLIFPRTTSMDTEFRKRLTYSTSICCWKNVQHTILNAWYFPAYQGHSSSICWCTVHELWMLLVQLFVFNSWQHHCWATDKKAFWPQELLCFFFLCFL